MVFVTTLTQTLMILDITKTESNQQLFYYTLLNGKNGGNVFASSLTASNTKRTNLT